MSYSFNGTSSYAYLAAAPIATTPVSVVAWVLPDDTAAIKTIYNARASADATNYYQLALDASEAVRATSRNSASSVHAYSSTAVSTSGWSLAHGQWAASGASRAAGFNGANAGSTESTIIAWGSTLNTMWIGGRGGTLERFVGLIGLVAIYSKVLSGAELVELTEEWPEDASSYGDCVAYWNGRSNVGSGTFTWNDTKGSANLGAVDCTYSTNNPSLVSSGGSAFTLPLHPSFRNTLLRM